MSSAQTAGSDTPSGYTSSGHTRQRTYDSPGGHNSPAARGSAVFQIIIYCSFAASGTGPASAFSGWSPRARLSGGVPVPRPSCHCDGMSGRPGLLVAGRGGPGALAAAPVCTHCDGDDHARAHTPLPLPPSLPLNLPCCVIKHRGVSGVAHEARSLTRLFSRIRHKHQSP